MYIYVYICILTCFPGISTLTFDLACVPVQPPTASGVTWNEWSCTFVKSRDPQLTAGEELTIEETPRFC